MSDHRLKQGPGDRLWQRIHASAVRGRLAKADAGQCQSVVSDRANHVLCLPEFVAQDAASSVQGVQPRRPDYVLRIRWRKRSDWLRIPRDELERRAEWPKLALLNEGQIHLQSAGQEEHAINPGTGPNVVVIDGSLGGHEVREVRQHRAHKRRVGYPERKIYVRPAILSTCGG